MASKAMVPFLVSMMLVTGVCNTLLTKFQDQQCVRDCDTDDPKYFEQPVIQTLQMFIGEMGSWLFIAGFAIYRRYAHGQSAETLTAYQRLGTTEDEDDLRNEDHDVEGDHVAAKVLLPNDESRRPLEGWKIVLLALPAICDLAGTTLMNVGLLFVAASIYQMTRGALVLFVGLFSVIFLRRRLYIYQWLALVLVFLGVAIVGLAGVIFPDTDPDVSLAIRSLTTGHDAPGSVPLSAAVKTLIGVLLIAGAQIFTATQFVFEEFILERYALQPLKTVAWEGTFGFLATVLGMIILHQAVGKTPAGQYGYFDAVEGWREITSDRVLAFSSILTMLSIGGFNYFGLSVTRTVSATSRSTIDTCRTLFIWIVSLALRWESFKWPQIIGFLVLVGGTFWFNDILPKRWNIGRGLVTKRRRSDAAEQRDELLPEEPIEHM